MFENKVPARQFQSTNIDTFLKERERLEEVKRNLHLDEYTPGRQ